MLKRVATELDVEHGAAAFFLKNSTELGARPSKMALPRLALQSVEGGTLPCVVIQVEETDERTVAGLRYFQGGSGVCFLEELEFVEESDDRLQRLRR